MPDQIEYKTVPVEQACIGMYVRLDVGWLNHPFATNSFLIRDGRQLQIIRQLDLKTIDYDPARSRLPAAGKQAIVQTIPVPEYELAGIREAKRARLEKLAEQRTTLAECQRKFAKAADSVKSINHGLFSRPAESVAAANTLVESMLDGMAGDKEIALVLVGESSGAQQEIYYHTLNVAVLAMILGREMGCSVDELELLGQGALFHDIGKTRLPDKVLMKVGPLTTSERNLLQQHPAYGAEIIRALKLPDPVLNMALCHHERHDGAGYPSGLIGNRISKLTGIISIVNAFDNLCNKPNPADSLPPYAALTFMFAKQRTHYDLAALSTFIRSMGVYPPGTIVVLSNGMRGLVVSVNAEKPLKPNVLVHDPAVPKEEAIILNLEEESDLAIVKSLRPSQLNQAEMAYLNPRKRVSYYFDEVSSSQKS